MQDLAKLIELYHSVRAQTMRLVAPLQIEDYVIQTATFMSPPRWHIGHTSWFFEMVLKEFSPGYQIYSDELLYFFNSYYEKFGTRIDRGKRGTKSRPTVAETVTYRRHIDESMAALMARADALPNLDQLLPLIRLGLEHEMQHQELLVYDIKHLLCDQYDAPTRVILPITTPISGMVEIEGGIFELGFRGDDFAYDNEKPLHKVYLQDYQIDRALVSNGDYLEFMRSGGYQDYRWWFSESWDVVNREKWQAPLYWEEQQGEWLIRDYHGLHRAVDRANEPVTHISYYEAHAYAKWAGKRLPTEAEWEKAACYDPERHVKQLFPWGNEPADINRANLLEKNLWDIAPIGSLPEGRSAYGCHQMIGDVWEWTASDYAPYPGFKSEFDEYTDKWFVNQRVLRGGSYATPQIHIRPTYRNYFYPHERWMISGFRCAL